MESNWRYNPWFYGLDQQVCSLASPYSPFPTTTIIGNWIGNPGLWTGWVKNLGTGVWDWVQIGGPVPGFPHYPFGISVLPDH